LKTLYIIFLLFLFGAIFPKAQSSRFYKDISEPLHHQPSFFPKTYDLQGYQLLLDSLIQWETTRSMYDYRFSGSVSQIKILSIITASEYGMAMYHYLEGIRRGLGDPLYAETEFLTALNYFKVKQDTSGFLHTTMHLLSVSLNSTMLNVGKIERHKNLYTEVLSLENRLKNPLDKIILLRIKILYDFYMTGPTSVSHHQKSITESLQLVEVLEDKYNYYKFLILNAIAIMHSLHVDNAESKRYHLLAYAFIDKKPCLDTKQTLRRIAMMQYIDQEYKEALATLDKIYQLPRNPNLVRNIEIDGHIYLNKGMAQLMTNDIDNAITSLKIGQQTIIIDFFKERQEIYMQDMAAVYKNQQNVIALYDMKKKQLNLIIMVIIFVSFSLLTIIYLKLNTNANKRLKKEIQRRDAIYLLIGHDLSSPIVAMGDTLSQIETNLGPLLSPTQKSYLFMLKTKIQGAYLLLLNLLQWYKTEIQEHAGDKTKKTANIKSNVDLAVEHLFFNTAKHDVTFQNLCPENIEVPLNEEKFQTIIRNLVDNAIKHAFCNNIIVNADLKPKRLIVTIEDDGIGMSKENADIINNPNRLNNFKHMKAKVGLGTIFILEFVEKMNSTIKVETHQKGTKFTWEIPMIE
jgi:signal transduction histidine kinase